MNNPRQHRNWILGISGRAARTALVLAIILALAAVAVPRAQAQSWFDNFDSYPLSGFPSPDWQPSGNNGTTIVNSTYVSADQSVQMYGVVGGCWGAVIHRELQVTPPYTIQFYARNGSESLSGCHPIRATSALSTGPSWTYPDRLLSEFGASGDFLTDWPTVVKGPAFPLSTWVQVQMTYEIPNAKHVRIGYWLNGRFYKRVTLAATSYEGQLAWLTLAANEGTVWFDNVGVTAGLPTLTTTTLTSSPNPSTYGQAVTFTAVVTSKAGVPPDGEAVYFMKGKTTLGTGKLSGGSAKFTTSKLKVGTTAVAAVYLSDANFPNNGFAGSNSKAVKQAVEKTGE